MSPKKKKTQIKLSEEFSVKIQKSLMACKNFNGDFDEYLKCVRQLKKVISSADQIPSNADPYLKESRRLINKLKKQGFLRNNPRPNIIYTGGIDRNRRRH